MSDLTFERYRDYINPGAAALLKFGGLEYPDWQGDGCIVTDVAGNEFIDCVAGYGVFSLGHRHPEVIGAVKRQLDLITLKTHYFLSIELGKLGEELARISPGRLQYSFLCNSGTEAVEGALKAARIHTRRKKVISTLNGFHGKTFGSLSASGRDVYKKDFEPLLEGFSSVPFGDVSAIERTLDDQTAAVIVEVVQGEGGVNVAPKGYLAAVRGITRQAGALLIVDEVRTALGRTGRMFGCEHDGVEPDLLTMAKALGGGVMPVAAFMGTPEIWESLFGTNPYLHSTTFGGNPLACAAAVAAIETTEKLNLPKRSAELGQHMLERLKSLQATHPEQIRDVRGLGLLAGVEFTSDDAAKLAIAACARNGLLVAYSLNNPLVIRIEPPLIMDRELLDKAMDVFGQSVDEALSLVSGMAGAQA
ncbi:MAG: aspartate aminotransferase family protein [Armatimonadetes bacterium]|nr:aspartate aminotransferase family protein [Armatimonadota bacterium]